MTVMQRFTCGALFVCVVCVSFSAHADQGELAGGALVGMVRSNSEQAMAWEVVARAGLTDALSARVGLGAAHQEAQSVMNVRAGVVAAWNVIEWIPQLWIYGGAQTDTEFSRTDALAGAMVGVRYVLGRNLHLEGWGGYEAVFAASRTYHAGQFRMGVLYGW